MQHFEYLQININYYPSADEQIAFQNNEEPVIWKGLQNTWNSFIHMDGLSLMNQRQRRINPECINLRDQLMGK